MSQSKPSRRYLWISISLVVLAILVAANLSGSGNAVGFLQWIHGN